MLHLIYHTNLGGKKQPEIFLGGVGIRMAEKREAKLRRGRCMLQERSALYQGFVFGFLPCAYYLCHLPNSRLRRSDTANNRGASTVEICESLALI